MEANPQLAADIIDEYKPGRKVDGKMDTFSSRRLYGSEQPLN